MKALITSFNTAIERLLVVDGNVAGQVHRLTRDETLAGGKGTNAARVLIQLAADPDFRGDERLVPELAGFTGGRLGALCRELHAAEGLTAHWVTTAAQTRVNEVIVDLRDPDGATVYNAAGGPVTEEESARLRDLLLDRLSEASIVLCMGSNPPGLPEDFTPWLIRAARERGIPVLTDTHGPALAVAVTERPDIVKVNRDELDALGGDPAADAWLAAGVQAVIVTDGARGVVARTVDGIWRATPPTVTVASGVGSGDAFAAGLAWSMLARRPRGGWPDHLRVACACGASNAAGITASLHCEAPPARLIPQVSITPLPAPSA
jgi:1-phosphofructokinase family hexose kinase